MPSHKHIQVAGSRGNTNLLVDVSSPSGGNVAAVASWQPETSKDSFWGAQWTDWKPAVPEPASAEGAGGGSLLDAPIDDSQHAPAMDKSDSKLRKLKLHHRDARDDDDTSDDSLDSAGTHTPQTSVGGLQQKAPQRRLLHEHEPKLIPQNRRDTTETVDRILAYINNPPVRRRMVPDEDWERMTPSELVKSLLRHNNLVRYLVKENRSLVVEVKDVDKVTAADAVAALGWKEDEHIDIVMLIELSKKDVDEMSRQELLSRLSMATNATEELLDMNDGMIRHLENVKKRR